MPSDQSVYAPNMQQVRMRIHRNSELVRECLGIPKRLAYGPTSIETFDLYATKAVGVLVNVFVHGGAWRAGVAKDNAAQAEMLVNAGSYLAVLDFNNVIETGGDLMTMADQIRLWRRLGLQKREKLRRRSRAGLYQRPFLRRPLGGRASHHRLAKGFRHAAYYDQRWSCWQRYVRFEAGAAVRPIKLCEVHR